MDFLDGEFVLSIEYMFMMVKPGLIASLKKPFWIGKGKCFLKKVEVFA